MNFNAYSYYSIAYKWLAISDHFPPPLPVFVLYVSNDSAGTYILYPDGKSEKILELYSVGGTVALNTMVANFEQFSRHLKPK